MNIWDFLLLGISLFLIALIIFQPSKDNITNAFSGESSELFKNQKQRGPELFLSRLTLGVSLSFIILTFVIVNFIHKV